MFKSWRNDKNKIKAVFKLQFQATQVPKLKKPALMISLVPDDVGKPTFKLQKTPVQDGICSWENPIFVSVKMIKEPKTGIIREKIYHFVVATGSSKSGFLGEASIDFADFLTEAEPLTVSLPLKFANSGAILHVTIHKMEGADDLRAIEKNGVQAFAKEESFKSQQSNGDRDNQDNKSSHGSFNSNGASGWVDDGLGGSTRQPNSVSATRNGHRRSNTDWSASSTSDGSFIESRNSPENHFPRGFMEDSSNPSDKQKLDVEELRRQSELNELEMQSLRKQVTKESKRVQELSKEVNVLKEERDELLVEYKELEMQKKMNEDESESRLRSISEDTSNMIEEIRDELNCEKELNSNLKSQLQRAEESNSNFILAVRDLNEMLELKNTEISCLNSELEESKKILDQETGYERQRGWKDEIDTLKRRNEELEKELDSYRKENEELENRFNELAEEHESLKEENHRIPLKSDDECLDSKRTIEELESQVERLEKAMKQQSIESAECMMMISALESEVVELKKELEEQARVFDEEVEAMMREKAEQEEKAIKAEEEMKRIRRKNAMTAERLQEKCKRMSLENEKITMETMAEANDLRMQKKDLEERLEEANSEVSEQRDLMRRGEEKCEALLMKVEMLETEVEKLTKVKYESEAAAMETEMLIREWRRERDGMERKIVAAKEEAEKAQKDLMVVKKTSNEEKETMVRNLRREVEGLSQQYSELQNSFVQEKMENEALKRQLSDMKEDIKRKEDDLSKILNARMEERRRADKEQKRCSSNGDREENLQRLMEELAYCKNRNSCMERELKEMEERYSEISLRFAEVEGERQQLVMAVRNLKNGKRN